MLRLAAILAAASIALSGCTAFRVLTTSPVTDPARVTVTAPSGTYALDPSHTSVHFKVRHFGFSNYVGRFNSVTGTLEFNPADPALSKLNVTISAASIDTNNAALEQQLVGQGMFDAEAFPEIRFVTTGVRRLTETSGEVTGDLTIKDRTRPLTLAVTFNGAAANPLSANPTLGFSATGKIDRSAFGLSQWPIAVGDTVSLEIEAEFFQEK